MYASFKCVFLKIFSNIVESIYGFGLFVRLFVTALPLLIILEFSCNWYMQMVFIITSFVLYMNYVALIVRNQEDSIKL